MWAMSPVMIAPKAGRGGGSAKSSTGSARAQMARETEILKLS
jgi:hypothetical protein